MDFLLRHSIALVVGLIVGMFLCLELGRRLGAKRLADDPAGKEIGLGAVEGAVFGLFGLLIAFTFQGAAERFNHRRALVAEEANDIGTAWLRIDLLPEPAQAGMRQHFRDYLDSRNRTFERTTTIETPEERYRLSQRHQERIWAEAVAGCRDAPTPCAIVLLPALNAMIDITTTRLMATRQHPPAVIFLMLMVLGLGCSVLAGYGMAGTRRRAWAHMILFAVTIASAVFIIIDMEYPRLGFIRVDEADQVMIDLRKSMH
jgi:hypothetical protein